MPPPPVKFMFDVPAVKVTAPTLLIFIAGLPFSVIVLLFKVKLRAEAELEEILFPVTEKLEVLKFPAVTSIAPPPTDVPKVNASPRSTWPLGALIVSPPPMVLPAVVSVPAVIVNLPVYVYV